jgi:ferritin-like metal-binding protein YciE
MKPKNLQDLLLENVRDLYDAEKQLLKALPKMADAAEAAQLKEAFEQHLGETRDHVSRLEQVFAELGHAARGKKCKAMAGLIEEGSETVDLDADPEVKDAALIASAQRVEHYEIAGYGCVCTWADLLGLKEVKKLLGATLDEEKNADSLLSSLAEGSINLKSVGMN